MGARRSASRREQDVRVARDACCSRPAHGALARRRGAERQGARGARGEPPARGPVRRADLEAAVAGDGGPEDGRGREVGLSGLGELRSARRRGAPRRRMAGEGGSERPRSAGRTRECRLRRRMADKGDSRA